METAGAVESSRTTTGPREPAGVTTGMPVGIQVGMPVGAPGTAAAEAAAAVVRRPVAASADSTVLRPRGGPVPRAGPRSDRVSAHLTALTAGPPAHSLAGDEKASSR